MSEHERPRRRRVLRRVLIALGCLLGGLVVLGIIGAIISPPPAPAPAAVPAPAPPPPPAGPPPTTVSGVIDGDTFRVGPRTVQVLGIDACETPTDLGPAATDEARRLLLAGPVVLTGQPGVDRDREGRDLRYVQLLDGRDYGAAMVPADHTAVLAGRNVAAPPYVAELRAADPAGRRCDRPDPPPPPVTEAPEPTSTVAPETDEPDVDAPDPDPPRRGSGGGRVGRDGDGDGLCNESTVPVPC